VDSASGLQGSGLLVRGLRVVPGQTDDESEDGFSHLEGVSATGRKRPVCRSLDRK